MASILWISRDERVYIDFVATVTGSKCNITLVGWEKECVTRWSDGAGRGGDISIISLVLS